jgi:hypothetical protein
MHRRVEGFSLSCCQSLENFNKLEVESVAVAFFLEFRSLSSFLP